MFRSRAISLLAALSCVLGLAAAASAVEVDCDCVYCFSAEDFSQEEGLAGICITQLLESSLGSVLRGRRAVATGDILTAQQAAQMTFVPAWTQADQSAQLCYLPIYEDHVAASAAMTLGIRGKENQPPVAEDSALETYKNLSNSARLKVSDPEGEAMTFTVTRAPRRGEVSVAADGSFTYTPKKNKVGVDSFTYTATDASGQVSREATVTITILKPTDAAQYTDTAGLDCRFEAEWMKNTGIFVGETVGERSCFSPEKTVTRGEFVTMLVKALDLPAEEDLTCAGYADEVPQWLQPYLAAAVRSGLTAGLPEQETFGAAQTITGAEAAVLLQNARERPGPALSEEEQALPAWAQAPLAALSAGGIQLDADAPLTRAQAAQALYQMARLLQAAETA